MTITSWEDPDMPQAKAAEAVQALQTRLENAGLILIRISRLKNRTRFQLRFISGEILNLFDTGRILIQGKNQNRVRSILGFLSTE